MGTEWVWIKRYAQQFEACAVERGDTAVVLSETRSRPEIVETSRLALQSLGAHVVDVVLATQPNPGPLPIRSTGASTAVAGNTAAIAACAAADFVADCTFEGLLHSPELPAILADGARVLMISNEHPENVERWPHDPSLADRVAAGVELAKAASNMRVTSAHGTDLSVDLADAVRVGSHGWTTEPGDIAHWPGGLVLLFPAVGTVNGRIVLAPGDINLSFKSYIESPVVIDLVDDHVVSITGDGADAVLLDEYLRSFGEPEALAISHVGWGLNTGAHRTAMTAFDRADHNGTEMRAVAGNFLWSTGANERAGRYCRGHVDIPMFGCTVSLDGTDVVTNGELV
ncbi:MAG: peptidase M29 [Actinobacteria bacterium]|nr:peptidase M29 [Actinomycetota bacterium]